MDSLLGIREFVSENSRKDQGSVQSAVNRTSPTLPHFPPKGGLCSMIDSRIIYVFSLIHGITFSLTLLEVLGGTKQKPLAL